VVFDRLVPLFFYPAFFVFEEAFDRPPIVSPWLSYLTTFLAFRFAEVPWREYGTFQRFLSLLFLAPL